MTGSRLRLRDVIAVLDDAHGAGVTSVRFYGGEPLLHNDLPAMVRHAVSRQMIPCVNTNGFLLQQKFKGLFEAGLRAVAMGYYGSTEQYERYTGIEKGRERVEQGIREIRENYGNQVRLRLNFLLSRQTCSVNELDRVWELASRYDLMLQIDLVHYSFPYFTNGPENELPFSEADRDKLERFVERLFELRKLSPRMMYESDASLRSIPDWALKKADMRVPCDAYKMIWIGADGSVQMCYVAFPLGNIHQTPLRDMLFTSAHRNAAQAAFKLNCPNCQCGRDNRINTHLPSLLKYKGTAAAWN
jgi:cyclic pyranopterin phosphate synthase